MADTTEKKTYLVNIESNLDKYSEDAAAAAKEVEKLTVENVKLKGSTTATAKDIEANNAALRNAQKEYKQAKNLVDLQTSANKAQAGSYEQLLRIHRLNEIALKTASGTMKRNEDGTYSLTAKYIALSKNVDTSKRSLDAFGKGIHDNRLNVGNYGEAIGGAFKAAGTSIKDMALNLVSFATVAALAAKAIDGIKEAFFSTDEGMGVLKRWTEAAKTFFYGVINQSNKGDIAVAMAAADELNALRIRDRKELLQIAQLETDIKLLRLESANASIGAKKQFELLTQAEAKENEIIILKKENLVDEIRAYEKLWMTRKEDSNLLDIINAKRVELEELEGSRSLRIATKKSAAQEKLNKEEEALAAKKEARLKKEFDDAQKAVLEGQKLLQKEVDDYIKMLEAKREADVKWNEEVDQIRSDFEERRIQNELTNQENIILAKEANNEWLYNSERERLDLEYQQEIANAERTGSSIALINEKYAAVRAQIDRAEADAKLGLYADFAGNLATIFGKSTAIGKAAAIAEATINTYRAAVGAYAALAPIPYVGPVLGAVAAAAAIVAGIANIKKIVEVKIPGGGGGGGSVPTAISNSAPAQRTFAQPAGSSVLTQAQLSQPQLNAIPNQNTLTAADIANALKGLPPPVVTVEDINAKVKSVNKVAVRANI